MNQQKRENPQIRQEDTSWGFVCSNGWASLNYYFSDKSFKKLTEIEKLRILSKSLEAVSKLMLEKGYIKFLSTSDISKLYGKSRQYWERLLKEGRLPYQQTSAGKITLNLWVEGFLEGNKNYTSKMNWARSLIIKKHKLTNKDSGFVMCPNCNRKSLGYNYNRGTHINASCTRCRFRIDTQE
ncbi:TFIIB-type zinc ribbon-containing protein [Candidatus Dojkabacteria bacterium]|nr:TFIIB-type zinc ribbon-containing protein [Candidatus Dojkabacteria bacterium]